MRESERFVTQHAQSAEHELHTRSGEGGCGQGRHGTRQHFCDSRAVALRAAHCSRQRTRAWGAQPHRRAHAAPSEGRPFAGMPARGWHLGDGRARTTAAAEGRGPVGAVGQRGWRRHAAAVDAERRAITTRPIVSIRWRLMNRNPAQTQSHAPKSRRLRSRRCSRRQCCQRATR